MKKRYTFSAKTWLRASLITTIACSFSLGLQAQTAPAKLWDKTFGGNTDERINSMQQTSDGGYILGGSSFAPISGDKTQASRGDFDYWIVKLDANGNKLWDKTFGGSGFDELFSLQQTPDGGYILGGSSQSGISGDKTQAYLGGTDIWVIKLDASGNKIWDKTIGGSGVDYIRTLHQTSDGGYILGGDSNSPISGDKSQASKGDRDYWVVKLDATGNKTWDKTIGGNNGDGLNALQKTSDGGYILIGSSVSGISGDKTQAHIGNNDLWVVRLDAGGNKIWDKTFGGSDREESGAVQQTSDGGFVLGGTSMSGISGDKSQASKGITDYWVLKIDGSGNKIWDKTIGGSGDDEFTSLQQTTDGGYILGGYSQSNISGDKTQVCQGSGDYWVVKLDASGNKTWDTTLGGNWYDKFSSLQQTPNGDYILSGTSGSPISGDKTQGCQGGQDFWIVKLGASVTGVKEEESGFAVSVYPNPGQGKLNLQLSDLTVPKVEITVSDLLGRVVLQQELQTTNQRISQELVLPSAKGIYLLKVKAGEQTTTRKIVVE